MRITKRQLKRIIKEEKARLLSEVKPSEMSMHAAAQGFEAVEDLLEVLATQFDVHEDEAAAYLRQMADRIEGK